MSPIQRMEQLSPFYSQNLNQQLQNVKQFNERLGQAPAKFTEQPASRVQDQAALLAKPGLLQTVSDENKNAHLLNRAANKQAAARVKEKFRQYNTEQPQTQSSIDSSQNQKVSVIKKLIREQQQIKRSIEQ